jgi:Leucine-rich repeat (LRR) protein
MVIVAEDGQAESSERRKVRPKGPRQTFLAASIAYIGSHLPSKALVKPALEIHRARMALVHCWRDRKHLLVVALLVLLTWASGVSCTPDPQKDVQSCSSAILACLTSSCQVTDYQCISSCIDSVNASSICTFAPPPPMPPPSASNSGPPPRIAASCCRGDRVTDCFYRSSAKSWPDYPWPVPCAFLAETESLELEDLEGFPPLLPDSWGHPAAFPKLVNLTLVNCGIGGLQAAWAQAGAFPVLQHLDVGSNDIPGVPAEWGQQGAFPQLQSLTLRRNALRALPKGFGFSGGMPFLKALDLSFNEVYILPESWADRAWFRNLTNLNLAANSIYTLPDRWGNPGAFENLELLNLVINSIAQVPEQWGQSGAFPRLSNLYLSSNSLASVPGEWATQGGWASLTWLSLGDNQLSDLPLSWGDSTAFPKLERLYLPDNNFAVLPAVLSVPFAFPRLRVLDVGSNPFSAFPESWASPGFLPSLISLDCISVPGVSDSPKITSLPDVWGRQGAFSNLRFLTLAGLPLRALPSSWGVLGAFPNLTFIYIDTDPLELLPASWGTPGTFPKLEELYIRGTVLKTLPDQWGTPGAFSALRSLAINSDEFLWALPANWSQQGAFPKLRRLALGARGMGAIPEAWGRAGSFPALQVLNLGSLAEWPTLDEQSFPSLNQLRLSAATLKKLPEFGPVAFPKLSFLDMTGAPASRVSSKNLWGACFRTGCMISLLNSSVKADAIPSELRETVCLGRISILLSANVSAGGSSTNMRWMDDNGNRSFGLSNYNLDDENLTLYVDTPGGPVFSNDSAFIDLVQLGLGGVHLTGLGFAPQAGNLCGNEGAKTIVIILWATWLSIVCVVTIGTTLYTWHKSRAHGGAQGRLAAGLSHWWTQFSGSRAQAVGTFLVACLGGIAFPVSQGANIGLLARVWTVWPKWVMLSLLILPYVVSGWYVAADLVSGKDELRALLREYPFNYFMLDFRLAGAQPESRADRYTPLELGLRKHLWALIWWGPALGITLLGDALAVFARVLGVHPRIGDRKVVLMEPFFDTRAFISLFFQGLPLAVFQSYIFVIGNSRSTNIYYDRNSFLVAIVSSLLFKLVTVGSLAYEAVDKGKFLPELIYGRWKKLRASIMPRLKDIP